MMTREFKTGVQTGLAIYGVGILLTIVLHLIFGWDSAHAPPTSFIGAVLALVVGAIRLLITTDKFLIRGSVVAKGEWVVHVVVAGLLTLFVLWVKYH
jgi:hypothetical protein